jgi:hypothetical protein
MFPAGRSDYSALCKASSSMAEDVGTKLLLSIGRTPSTVMLGASAGVVSRCASLDYGGGGAVGGPPRRSMLPEQRIQTSRGEPFGSGFRARAISMASGNLSRWRDSVGLVLSGRGAILRVRPHRLAGKCFPQSPEGDGSCRALRWSELIPGVGNAEYEAVRAGGEKADCAALERRGRWRLLWGQGAQFRRGQGLKL